MTAGIVCLFFLTISGVIEHMPFFNSKAGYYAPYPSSIINAVRQNSPPKAVFVGDSWPEVYLAGRKMFVGNQLGGEMRFKKNERKKIIKDIYASSTVAVFCGITKTYKINFVEFNQSTVSPMKETANLLPHIDALDVNKNPVAFVDVKRTCL